jgi:hypothetical protein
MFRASTSVVSDLTWFFNESEGAIKGLRSTWSDVVLVKQAEPPAHIRIGEHWYDRSLQLSGRVYVPKEQHHQASYEMSGRALAAARREAPILSALQFAGPDVFEALRHRFREKLLVCRQHVPDHLVPFVDRWRAGCRIPFGLEGQSGRRGSEFEGCLGVMLNPLRGCGAVAHLTQAARAAYAKDRLRLRVRLDVAGWVDRLGGRICQGEASEDEQALGRELRRQAEALVYGEGGALDRYSRLLLRRRRAG